MKKQKFNNPQYEESIKNRFQFIKQNYVYLLLVVLLAYYTFMCYKISFIQDDTYITLQYAKNFANDNGLVFNVGEKVEGFTSLFWVIFLGAAYKVGLNIESLSQILSVGFSIISLVLTYVLFLEITKGTSNKNKNYLVLFSFLSVLITSLNGTYYYWAVSGMETSLFTMAYLSILLLYLKYYLNEKLLLVFPSTLFVLSLIRPEGNIIFVLILIHSFFVILIKSNFKFKETFKSFFNLHRTQGYLIFIFLVTSVTIFRLLYFGYPLPNTFYAKTGFSIEQIRTGFDYFIDFLNDYTLYGLIILAPLYLFRFKKKIKSISFLYLNLFSFIIYVILIGGDVLTQYRFFVPVIPIINILFCLLIYFISTTLKETEIKTSMPMLFIIPFSVAVFINIINSEKVENLSRRESAFVENMKRTSLWLKSKSINEHNNLTVAASTIGALAYFSDGHIIDMLGLTDKYIAHNPEYILKISDESVGWKERKYNADYILRRKPDYILFSTQEKPSSYAERALFTKTDFHKNYFVYLYDPDNSKVFASIYKRRNDSDLFIKDTLNTNPNFSIEFISLYTKVLNYTSLAADKIGVDDFITECKQLVKISPSYFGDSYRLLAWINLQLGKNKEAIENAKMAIRIDGINLKASIILVSAYLTENNFDLAEYEIDKIEKVVPQLAHSIRESMLKKKEYIQNKLSNDRK